MEPELRATVIGRAITTFCQNNGYRSVIEFGFEKGVLAPVLRANGLLVYEYDPTTKISDPEPADVVIVVDVMEHIAQEDIDGILNQVVRLANHIVYFWIDNGPANTTLPVGQNANLIAKNAAWWREKLSSHFLIVVCQNVDKLTTSSGEPLAYFDGATLAIVVPIKEIYNTDTKIVGGWHLPKAEKHFRDRLSVGHYVEGRRTYQYNKLKSTISMCKNFRRAIDIGAHVGLWSYFLSYSFNHVISFEPVPDFVDCFRRNVENRDNIDLYPNALGSSSCTLGMALNRENSGMSHISAEQVDVTVDSFPLDTLNLENVDLIKIDVEGYEMHVICGAINTILKCKPVIILEQKEIHKKYGAKHLEAKTYLEELGMIEAERLVDDYIMVWN